VLSKSLTWNEAPAEHSNCSSYLTNRTDCHIYILQAVEEEKLVYERSSSKYIYLNLAVHTLRHLREETATTPLSPSPTKNPNCVSHEVVLGGPKACQTSFTVHRSGKQPSPPSSFSGNFSKTICCIFIVIIIAQ